MDLLDRLPKIKWNIDRNTSITANDFMIVYQLNSEWIDDETSDWEWYHIQQGDTPQALANRFYGEPTLHWVIPLANRIVDWYKETPMSEQELIRYLMETQFVEVYAQNADGEYVYNEDLSGELTLYQIYTAERLEYPNYQDVSGNTLVLKPHHYELSDGEWVSELTPNAIGISHYTQETRNNENKRRVKVPSKRQIQHILAGLKDLR